MNKTNTKLVVYCFYLFLLFDFQSVVKRIVASRLVDPDKVGVIGGSHGGFLTGHLIGQYPVSDHRKHINNVIHFLC